MSSISMTVIVLVLQDPMVKSLCKLLDLNWLPFTHKQQQADPLSHIAPHLQSLTFLLFISEL